MNFFTKTTLATSAIFGAAILGLLFFASSDAAEVEALVLAAEEDLNRFDAEAVAALIYDGYDHDGADAEGVRRQIREKVAPERFEAVKFGDVAVEVIGDEATVRFRLTFRGGSLGMMNTGGLRPWRVALRRVAGSWRVVAIDPPDPYR